MDRVAVFVDAGYVFAQGSVLLTGRKRPRRELQFDAMRAVAKMSSFAADVSGLPVLRLYWYDGTSSGPTPQHLSLAYLPGVKLRLGFVNSVGEQKGVDSLIVTDMIELARNRAMSEAVLLSGDEDLRVGVQQAQSFGVRIHLVGIKPARGSQSTFLLQEADSTHVWDEATIAQFLEYRPRAEVLEQAPPPPTGTSGAAAVILEQVATEVAASVADAEIETLLISMQDSGGVPKELHAKLLTGARRLLRSELSGSQRREIRRLFVVACERRRPRPA
jgi:hypothetical protein